MDCQSRPHRGITLVRFRVLLAVTSALILIVPAVASAATSGPTAQDCAVCHAVPQSHSAAHQLTSLSGTVEMFSADHESAGTHIGIAVDCGLCHDISDVAAIHDNRCSTCHPSPADTFTGWANGCSQGGCHPTYHTQAAAGHAAAAQSGYTTGCLACHDMNTWEVPTSNCGDCHALVDHIAPTTTSDVIPAYVGPATIHFTAGDLPSPGGSGVAQTYRVLDGGIQTTGTALTVGQPASGSASHTIRFWSVDRDGNVETSKTASFTVAADNTPPSTSSDAKSSYIGPAKITLTVTDNGTSKPVTRYILDGAPAVTGTVVSVPQPASGTAAHTLEFWSVDGAGNIETHKNVGFTVGVDTAPPVTTSNTLPFYQAGNPGSTITLTATDTGSGVKATYYKLDGSAVVTSTVIFVTQWSVSAGRHTLEFWSVDNAGNAEPHKTNVFTVDRTAPVTTSDAQTAYSGSATIHLTGVDNSGGAGVAGTQYKLDGNAPVTGTVLTVPNAGPHVLEFWSVDAVGNAENPHKTVTFTVLGAESIPPTTTSDVTSSYVSSATIHFTATDNPGGSGVQATYYKLDGGAQTAGTQLTVYAPGTHTLEFWSVDNAGNEETPHNTTSFTITVPAGQGTIQFAWNDVPPEAWTYYYVYDSSGNLVASSYNTTGWFIVNVPVSSKPYTLKVYWYADDPGYPVWSYGSALIDTSGKVVTWQY